MEAQAGGPSEKDGIPASIRFKANPEDPGTHPFQGDFTRPDGMCGLARGVSAEEADTGRPVIHLVRKFFGGTHLPPVLQAIVPILTVQASHGARAVENRQILVAVLGSLGVRVILPTRSTVGSGRTDEVCTW